MAEVMLDCTLCGSRKLQSLREEQVRELQDSAAARFSCPTCNRETLWSYAQYDRRESRDRRRLPEEPMEPLIQRPAVQPPPNKDFFRQAALRIAQAERRSGAERRQEAQRDHARVPLQLPLRVRVNTAGLRFEEVTRTTNVCRTGVFFRSNLPYAQGTPTYVTLNYSAQSLGSNIEQNGTVVRVEPKPAFNGKGVAIHFG